VDQLWVACHAGVFDNHLCAAVTIFHNGRLCCAVGMARNEDMDPLDIAQPYRRSGSRNKIMLLTYLLTPLIGDIRTSTKIEYRSQAYLLVLDRHTSGLKRADPNHLATVGSVGSRRRTHLYSLQPLVAVRSNWSLATDCEHTGYTVVEIFFIEKLRWQPEQKHML
jgi:hypothetical protein